MTSRRLVGLGGLALAAADRSHGRQTSLLDPWRLSTPQIHPTKLAFKRDQFIFSGTSPSSRHTVRARASPFRALLACAILLLPARPLELRIQSSCCPYRCRNRKPFRAAGRAGRPARAGEERNGAGPQSPQIVLRTEEACALVTTTTSAQAQPSTELKGTGGKQQYGAG